MLYPIKRVLLRHLEELQSLTEFSLSEYAFPNSPISMISQIRQKSHWIIKKSSINEMPRSSLLIHSTLHIVLDNQSSFPLLIVTIGLLE